MLLAGRMNDISYRKFLDIFSAVSKHSKPGFIDIKEASIRCNDLNKETRMQKIGYRAPANVPEPAERLELKQAPNSHPWRLAPVDCSKWKMKDWKEILSKFR